MWWLISRSLALSSPSRRLPSGPLSLLARRLMDQHELDRILVVEDGRLVGIISEADIRSDEGPLGGGVTEEPASRLTDTVRRTTDKLLGRGGEEKQR